MTRRWLLAVLLLLGGPGFAHAQAGCGYSFLSSADSAACAIRKDDDTVDCWGDSFYGADEVAGTFAYVQCGFANCCGVKTDGSLACWGDDSFSVNTDVLAGTDYVAVTSGIGHACALKTDDSVGCWGDLNSEGEQTVPAGTYDSISCHTQTCCGVKTDGSLACWGDDATDLLTDKPAGTDFVEVEVTRDVACARKTDDTAVCWGTRDPGSLSPAGGYLDVAVSSWGSFFGILESDCSLVATEGTTPDLEDYDERPVTGIWQSIQCGWESLCALQTSGDVICWGDDSLTDIVTNAPVTTCDDVACPSATTTTTTTTTLPNYVAMSVGM